MEDGRYFSYWYPYLIWTFYIQKVKKCILPNMLITNQLMSGYTFGPLGILNALNTNNLSKVYPSPT